MKIYMVIYTTDAFYKLKHPLFPDSPLCNLLAAV